MEKADAARDATQGGKGKEETGGEHRGRSPMQQTQEGPLPALQPLEEVNFFGVIKKRRGCERDGRTVLHKDGAPIASPST